eukprot:scaffold11452_cov38-Prasinocladus_malaysianus.AAC.2
MNASCSCTSTSAAFSGCIRQRQKHPGLLHRMKANLRMETRTRLAYNHRRTKSPISATQPDDGDPSHATSAPVSTALPVIYRLQYGYIHFQTSKSFTLQPENTDADGATNRHRIVPAVAIQRGARLLRQPSQSTKVWNPNSCITALLEPGIAMDTMWFTGCLWETHTLVVLPGSEEMITMFHVTGGLVYCDSEGNPVGYDDVFSKLEKAREHYEKIGLGADYVNQFIR